MPRKEKPVEATPETGQPVAFKVDARVAQAVLNYLVTRPYDEVGLLIPAFQGAEPVFAEDDEDE